MRRDRGLNCSGVIQGLDASFTVSAGGGKPEKMLRCDLRVRGGSVRPWSAFKSGSGRGILTCFSEENKQTAAAILQTALGRTSDEPFSTKKKPRDDRQLRIKVGSMTAHGGDTKTVTDLCAHAKSQTQQTAQGERHLLVVICTPRSIKTGLSSDDVEDPKTWWPARTRRAKQTTTAAAADV